LFEAAKNLGERSATFNGDGTRLLLTNDASPRVRDTCGGSFELYSGTDGKAVTATGLSQVTNGTDPEWSPDSSAIAYSEGGKLLLLPETGPDAFGAPAPLGGSGNYDWHPTWSPDSQWLAYQHGTGCNTGTRSGAFITGSLRLIARDGSHDVALDHLNAGTTYNWRPVFSPFDSGGYFWVVYSSARPYGNALGGVSGKKQLWIAAISDRPDSVADPSEVPYYLDGQEPMTNLQSYWAPAPCQAYQGPCETDGQCCSGRCTSGKCETPSACHERGESCAVTSDCCVGASLECRGNLCDIPIVH
jgi:Tol biopolymer transport system component